MAAHDPSPEWWASRTLEATRLGMLGRRGMFQADCRLIKSRKGHVAL